MQDGSIIMKCNFIKIPQNSKYEAPYIHFLFNNKDVHYKE